MSGILVPKPMLGRQLPAGSARGLVAYWLLNEGSGKKVSDLSGNGNNGTVHPDVSWVSAKFGAGLDFDGVSDGRVEVLPMGQMNKNTFTVVMWIYNRSDGEGNKGYIWNWGSLTRLQMNSVDTRVRVYVDWDTDGIWDSGSGVFLQNQWMHFVVAYDGSSVSNNPVIYRNGVDISSIFSEVQEPVGTFVQPSTKTFWIGNNYASAVRAADCIIDNLSVYNRVLNSSEIVELYLRSFAMFDRMPIELWVGATSVGVPPVGNPWNYYAQIA